MQLLKYTYQNNHNWYLGLKETQLEVKIAGSISDKILGGAFGALAASVLMTALHRVNPPLYNQVQDKEITIEQAAQQEISNELFIEEIAKIDPNFGDEDKKNEVSSFIQKWEGFLGSPKMLPNEEYYTIGIGHRLDGSKRSRSAFSKALPHKNYDQFYRGQGSVTKKEAQTLFQADLPNYVDRARNLTGDNFDSYSSNLQKNIISATYRGSWGYSPKTRRLLAEGKFEEAADEFLNSNEYRDAIKLNRRGIRKRMEAVAEAIRQEGYKKNWNLK